MSLMAKQNNKMSNNRCVIAFSGGADSSVLLYMAAATGYKEIHTLSFDYGQRHKRELLCIPKQIENLKLLHDNIEITNKVLDVGYIRAIAPVSSLTNSEIDNPDISKMAGDAQPVTYVPFRNMMFLSICSAYAESIKADTVWYGAAQIDSAAGMWDCDESFVDCINGLVSLNRQNKIKIEAPLLPMSKVEILKRGIELGVDFSETWTCYSNREDGLADATTPSSSLRLKAFIELGYRDPIQYAQQKKINKLYDLHNCVNYPADCRPYIP